MRLAYTSDLHYPITDAQTIQAMIAQLIKDEPDVIVIGGDVGESLHAPEMFRICLKLFRDQFEVPILVLAGNHDLWCGPNTDYDAKSLFEEELPKMCEEIGCVWLEDTLFTHGKLAIVGTYAHYDFSARELSGVAVFPVEFYETNGHKIINDARFMKGITSNVDFSNEIGAAFKNRLLEVQQDDSISEIIVCSHVPLTEEQMTRRPHDFNWAIATAFFGNFSHVKTLRKCTKISHILSGHSHRNAEGIFQQLNSSAYAITLGADYRAPAYRIIESVV